MSDDEETVEITKTEWRALKHIAQERISKWTSRRGFIKGAATGGALAGLGIGAAAGTASAADTSSGKLGAAGDSQDIFLDEILDESGDQVADLDDTGLFAFQRGLDVPEIATASATINNHPTLDDIEWGTATLSGPGAASDGTVDTNASNATTVNFDASFDAAPHIVVSFDRGDSTTTSTGMGAEYTNVSTTSFVVRIYNYSTTDYSGDTFAIGWVALN